MQQIIGQVVNLAQCGFIPGRSSSDNILLAGEIIKGYNRVGNSPRAMVKVDLRKAYDSIDWRFIKTVLEELGFPSCYVAWVMECVTSVSYSVLVNGKPLPPFPAKRGLRQGDPLSPYLFALGMEYLSRLMTDLDYHPEFKYHPKCSRNKISHLLFADDLLMFCKADPPSIKAMWDAFQDFSRASGLSVNEDKSCVFLSGVNIQAKLEILTALNMAEGSLPFRYLGVPLHSRKINSTEFVSLVDMITGRIRSWANRLLSYAGRIELVKSVLGGMKNFWAQIFCLPKKVTKKVEAICRTFIWTGTDSGSKKANVRWEKMCLPVLEGGLGLRNMVLWNEAAMLKHLWNLAKKKDSLWVRWVHSYYIRGRDLAQIIPPPPLLLES